MTWSVVAAIAGIAAVVVTIWYGRRQVGLAQEQLRLAREQAELRPELEASLNTVVFLPPDTLVPYEQAAVVFNITNNGKSAAHGVRCEFRVEEPLGAHDQTMGQNRDFEKGYIGPKETFSHDFIVDVHDYGWTKARYVCICDEVGESAGVVEFEVRNTDRR